MGDTNFNPSTSAPSFIPFCVLFYKFIFLFKNIFFRIFGENFESSSKSVLVTIALLLLLLPLHVIIQSKHASVQVLEIGQYPAFEYNMALILEPIGLVPDTSTSSSRHFFLKNKYSTFF